MEERNVHGGAGESVRESYKILSLDHSRVVRLTVDPFP